MSKRALEKAEREELEALERHRREHWDAWAVRQPVPEGYIGWGSERESGLTAPPPDPAEREPRRPLTAPRWAPQRPWWPRRPR
jgi:hypothetical protein